MERSKSYNLLINDGNFAHNLRYLRGEISGPFIVARREKTFEYSPRDFLPCVTCRNFFLRQNLWHHVKTCNPLRRNNTDTDSDEKLHNSELNESSFLLQSAILVKSPHAEELSELFSRMQADDVTDKIKSDPLLCRYAFVKMQALGKPKDRKHGDIHQVSQKVRTLQRLVTAVKPFILQLPEESQLMVNADVMLRPNFYDEIIHGAMTLIGDKCSLAPRLGYLLSQLIQVKIGLALRDKNMEKKQEALDVREMYKDDWLDRVIAPANKMKDNLVREQAPRSAPLASDVKIFRSFLIKEAEAAALQLENEVTLNNWTALAKVVTCYLILFNGRRQAEVAELKVSAYTTRSPVGLDPDLVSSMDREFAKRLVIK